MRLTKKLLGWLPRFFDTNPSQFLALRLSYDGSGMTWKVSDAVLTTVVNGGSGVALSVDLTAHTLRSLVNYLAAQPGYSVPRAAAGDALALSARVLIDAAGDIGTSNGDHLYGYTSLTWAYMEAVSVELQAARAQIPEAIDQMVIGTADQEWLDELGVFYGVKRLAGEADPSYSLRIVAEVLRPRSNNVAIEAAITYYTGQSTKVTDVTTYGDAFPLYDGEITRNSQYLYQASARPLYCLFDVQYGYDLLSASDPTAFAQRVRSIIERLRAAGTHLRSLSLQAGSISDAAEPPSDRFGGLTVSPSILDTRAAPTEKMSQLAALSTFGDSPPAPDDNSSVTIVYDYRYNSTRTRNGAISYMGGMTVVE